MSLFDLEEQDMIEYQDWMQGIRKQISQTVNEKSSFYSFNFTSGEPNPDGRICWEQTKEITKRLSTLRRSTVSTMFTSGEELTEDIPNISDLELRISQELMASPIVLLPHKR